jgi:hypothetical protein
MAGSVWDLQGVTNLRTLASSIAVAAMTITFSGTVAFGAGRTWVSHNGTDQNGTVACNELQPCLSFGQALAHTDPGGEVNCLDSGEFTGVGTLTINQSVTIDCAGSVGGVTNVTFFNGIVINGGQIVVKLRNLTLNGVAGTTNHGVVIQDAAQVTIENCVIQNYGGTGIFAQNSNALQLHVADTLIASNGGNGINIGGSGTTNFVLDRVSVENSPGGNIFVFPNGGTVTGAIRDSVVMGSQGNGITAVRGSSPAVTVSLDHTHVTGNGGGIVAGSSAVILNNSTIQQNGLAINADANSGIFSYGNNAINGNQPGGIGTVPTLIGFH